MSNIIRALIISASAVIGVLAVRTLFRHLYRKGHVHTVRRALKFGVIIESTLCGISVVSVLAGGVGPCGLTGEAPGFVRFIHQPGFWLSGYLVKDSSPSYLLLSVVLTTAMLSVLAYFVLSILHERHKKPVAPPDGPASRSQPFRSETNRMPPAAGSGR